MPQQESPIGKSPADLAKTIRRNRQLKVSVGRFRFVCRRPTDTEAAVWYRGGAKDADLYLHMVEDWNLTENDVVGGGGTDEVKFDLLLWQEWIVDHVECWEPIVRGVLDAYTEHQKSLDAIEKKS